MWFIDKFSPLMKHIYLNKNSFVKPTAVQLNADEISTHLENHLIESN